MSNNLFFRVAAASPRVKVADVNANVEEILRLVRELNARKVDLIVFPELCLTGYTCGDLFHSSLLLDSVEESIARICNETRNIPSAFIIGAPLRSKGSLHNCAILIHRGEICLKVAKSNIPNYNEFYEKRWFAPFDTEPENKIYTLRGVNISIEICEDLWVPSPPSVAMCLRGADIVANLSASDDITGKYTYLTGLIKHQSAALMCGYVYASCGFGESSTDLVFDGKAIIAENGTILARNERWHNDSSYAIADIDVEMLRRERLHHGTFPATSLEDVGTVMPPPPSVLENPYHNRETTDIFRQISKLPFVPENTADRDERCEEILNIQTAGLAQRLDFTQCRRLVVGISGGLDSTLALIVACRAFDRLGLDRSGIVAVTMPGFGTSGRTKKNAFELCMLLGVTIREIPINRAVEQHFSDIGHNPEIKDITYENSQARQRTLILMNLANELGGMVLGTGDLSELALGWATYNGDHMSMYGVNAGVPKTLVRHLIEWYANLFPTKSDLYRVLTDIVDTPVSPELLPPDSEGKIAQKTEDVVGPYELHDFFLYHTLRYGESPKKIFILAQKAFGTEYSPTEILKWMKVFYRRFFVQQFKRSCLPDGPKVGSVCLSPRGDWRMPSDASSALWLEQLNEIEATL